MGQITLQAPDGTPRTFAIEGDSATPEEMRTFLKIMKMSNPDPNADAPNPVNQAKQGTFDAYDANEIKDNNTASYDFRVNTPAPIDAVESSATPFLPNNAQQDTVNTSSMAATATPVGDTIPDVQPEVQSTGPDAPDVAQTQSSENETVISSEQDPTSSQFGPSFESPELEVPQTRDAVSRSTVQATEPFTPAEDLPPPSSGMFDGLEDNFMTPDEKEQVVTTQLNKYITHPRTERRWDGRYIYTDAEGNQWRVPRIFWNKPTNEAYVVDSWAMEGIEDGTKNTIEFIGDVADLARNMISDDGITDDESWGQWIRDNTSQYSEEGRGARAVGGEFAGIFGVGGPILKGVKSVTKLFTSGKEVGKFRQGLRSLRDRATEAAVLQAPIDGTASGLLLGENALFKASDYMAILEDLDPDASDAEWQQRLENRRNMILEGAAISKLFTSTLNAGVQGVRVLNTMTVGGLWNATRKTAQQKAAMAEITEKLLRVEGATTDAQRKEFLEAFAASLDKYAKEINQINDSLIQSANIDRTTMNAFMVAVDEGDFLGAANIASRAKNPQGLLNVAAGIQQGAVQNPNLANTALKSEAAQSTYAGALGTVDESLGGASTIQSAADQIQTGPLGDDAARLRSQGQNITNLEAQLDNLDDELISAINTGGELSSKMNSLSQLTGINLSLRTDEAAETLLSRVTAAYRNLKGQRQNVYGAVQGGDLDTRGLFNFLREMDPADLSEAATTLGYAPRLKALFNSVADRQKKVAGDTTSGLDNFDPVPRTQQSVAMTDDELFEEFADALEEAGIVDYGSLFKNLRADLARTKSDLFQSGGNAQKSAGRSLNDLIKFIDGDLLDSTQSVELIETVARAKDWDTTNFLPYFGDPESALGKVGNMWDQNMGSTEIAGVARSTSYNDLARNILTDALTQRTRNNGVQIVKLLQRPEGGSTEELTDFILFDALQPIMAGLRAQGQAPTNEAMQQAFNNLMNYRSVLAQANPKLYNEISEFADTLATGTYNRDDILKRISTAEKTYARTQKKLQDGALADFFDAQGIPIEIGMDSFSKLINNFTTGANNTGRLSTITAQFIEEANNGNTLLLEGLQAAYIKRFKEATMTTSMGASRSGGIKQIRSQQELDTETGKWLQGLKIVFQDRPEAAELIEVLYAKAAQEQGFRLARAARNESASAKFLQPAIEKLGNIITLVYGNLSRTGARLRRAGTAILNKNFNAVAWDAMMDDILSNPETAKKLVDQLIKEEFGSKIGAEAVETAINALVYTGMFGPEDEEEARAMNFEIIEATAAAEANVREYTNDGKTFIGDIWQQTKDAFSEQFLR